MNINKIAIIVYLLAGYPGPAGRIVDLRQPLSLNQEKSAYSMGIDPCIISNVRGIRVGQPINSLVS
jgi:hypothetical protein